MGKYYISKVSGFHESKASELQLMSEPATRERILALVKGHQTYNTDIFETLKYKFFGYFCSE